MCNEKNIMKSNKMKSNILYVKKVVYLVSIILFFFNKNLYPQIIYTDIIPDATPNATYSLDLNNDLIIDFIIHYGAINKILCAPQYNNAYSGSFLGGIHLPWALTQTNDICDTLLTWYDSTNPGTMAWDTNIGHWVGNTNKYLALKLVVGTNTYYGWARLDITANSTSFTIKDYAYESTPNTCIQAGQTPLGIKENTNKNIFSIFPNPFNSKTTILTNSKLNNANIKICNIYGQIIKQVDNIFGHTISLSRDNLTSGIYFIKLTSEKKIIAVEQLIISD